jgi:hypothetical protein
MMRIAPVPPRGKATKEIQKPCVKQFTQNGDRFT